MENKRLLKGDEFLNRYRIEGELTTVSPFHLGNGFTVPGTRKRPEVEKDGKKELVEVTAIATDWRGRPVIPGSSIKGALRGYLLDVLSASPVGAELLAGERNRDYERIIKPTPGDELSPLQAQEKQIQFMREEAGFLERVFGTPFAEGKIEVWDGECVTEDLRIDTPALNNPASPPFWDPKRLTFIDQSVAIDPDTKTAIDKKLYHYEVVPPGISFKLILTGQNLVPIELGMLFFGLEALNSGIWPLALGGMTNRGFGRFSFQSGQVKCLQGSQLDKWIRDAAANDHAGYETLYPISKKDFETTMDHFKTAFLAGLGG